MAKTYKIKLLYNNDRLFPCVVSAQGNTETEAIESAKNHIAEVGHFGRFTTRERIVKRLTVTGIVEIK